MTTTTLTAEFMPRVTSWTWAEETEGGPATFIPLAHPKPGAYDAPAAAVVKAGMDHLADVAAHLAESMPSIRSTSARTGPVESSTSALGAQPGPKHRGYHDEGLPARSPKPPRQQDAPRRSPARPRPQERAANDACPPLGPPCPPRPQEGSTMTFTRPPRRAHDPGRRRTPTDTT
jgi:hypothetical protein